MVNRPDRLKEHARVRLMDYWIVKDGEKIQLPLQEDGYVGHFGDMINFVLKRVLRELDFPWSYNISEDRIEFKHINEIKDTIRTEFAYLTKTSDVRDGDLINLCVYANKAYTNFYCYPSPKEDDDKNFICFISFKLIA